MTTTATKVSYERLREVLEYEPSTGIFKWRVDRIRVRPGDIAGKRKKGGYVEICIDGKGYQAHRLAYLYMTGEHPVFFVDHINLDRYDNRWINLRAATNSQNQMNTPKKSNNTSGFKGVSWHRSEKRWRADIRIDGQKVFLGYFDSPEDGHLAYVSAISVHHGQYARSA